MNVETPDSAIGVFDSGVGGLSVLRAIRQQLPTEQLIYVADSGHAPYGERDNDYIANRCLSIAKFLTEKPVKALVVACNTASVLAINELRNEFTIPIVGIEPAIKPATSITKTGVVGVLATNRTTTSPGVKRLCELYGKDVEVILQPCPGLVDLIERAELNSPNTIALLEKFLKPLIEAEADTIVLGCTHYPFVREAIQQLLGSHVEIIEPGAAVARQLARRLDELELRMVNNNVNRQEPVHERTEFYTTGDKGSAEVVISALLGGKVDVRDLSNV